MTCAEILKEVRRQLGLTQAELGTRTGTYQGYINRVESGGIKYPGVDFMAQLYRGCNVNPFIFVDPTAPLFVPKQKEGITELKKKIARYDKLIEKLHEATRS